MKCTRIFHTINDVIYVQNLRWQNESFESFAIKRIYKIIRTITCVSKIVVYIAFCLNCVRQGVGSTVDLKPRLLNYKFHIEKKV